MLASGDFVAGVKNDCRLAEGNVYDPSLPEAVTSPLVIGEATGRAFVNSVPLRTPESEGRDGVCEPHAILSWPEPLPPAKFLFEEEGRVGHALDSMVCAGVIVSGATVRRSILSPGVHLHSSSEVEGSILIHGVDVGRGAVVRNAIVDKNVRIDEGAQVGVDLEADRERFVVSPGSIAVIAKSETVEA